jgi:hypothetical protein
MTNLKPTLILSPRFSTDSNKVWKAAIDSGWNIHRAIRYQPPETNGPVCVYGERVCCEIMAENMNLGLLDPPDRFLTDLPEGFVNRHIEFTTVKALQYSKWTRKFVKPACASKPFQAGIYEKGMDIIVTNKYIDFRCPVYVSEIVEFVAEVRLFILDGNIISSDQYNLIIEKEPEEVEKEAKEYGYMLLDYLHMSNTRLPSAVVIDVGYIQDRGWSVIEANQAYSSGIYTEDRYKIEKLLPLFLRASGRKENVSEADREFIRRYY